MPITLPILILWQILFYQIVSCCTILWVKYDAQIAVSDENVLGEENSDEITYAV